MRVPTVFIICGVFNRLNQTKELLICLHKQSYPAKQIIIVDDGSTDGTFEYIKKYCPEVTILKGSGDLWWTGAVHWGVEEALKKAKDKDFILTINNDCTMASNYLDTLVKISQLNGRSITGSLIIDKKNKNNIFDAGTRIDWAKGRFILLGPKLLKDLDKGVLFEDKIDTLPTKGTLYPIEVFQKIGNFDKKNLPHYVSDYEFACRAKKAGFKLILSFKARVYNDIGQTGFGDSIPNYLSLKQVFSLFFSRKSKVNILDHYRFVRLCCPPQYRLRNYIICLLKILSYLKRLKVI